MTEGPGRHLFSRSGFLDDSWFWRSYWIFGKEVDSNYGGWLRPGTLCPCGRLIVFDDAFDLRLRPQTGVSVQRIGRAVLRLWGRSRSRATSGRARAGGREADQRRLAYRAGGVLRLGHTQEVPHGRCKMPPTIIGPRTRCRFTPAPWCWPARRCSWPGPRRLSTKRRPCGLPTIRRSRPSSRPKLLRSAARWAGRFWRFPRPTAGCWPHTSWTPVPTFDGMAAARGCLYLTTLDGRVLCLGDEGTPLPFLALHGLRRLDTSVPPLPAKPAPRVEPSLAGKFAHTEHAAVTKSSLGYHLLGTGKAAGLALKKLPQPLGGKISLKVRMRLTADGKLRNGFLVFGPNADEATLIKCGLRLAMKKAVIIEGPVAKGKIAASPMDIEQAKVYDIEVMADPASGLVTMKVGAVTVEAQWDHPPVAVSFVGFATLDAGAGLQPSGCGSRPPVSRPRGSPSAAYLTRRKAKMKLLASLAAVVITCCVAAGGLAAPAGADHPNIVIILADDLGYGDVKCNYPDGKIPTPHLDRLASQGMRFTDAHAPSSLCSPTRYAMLTGRYAWRTRLKAGVLGQYDKPLIEAGRLTLPAMLKQHGYQTAAVGKWHLGMNWPFSSAEAAKKVAKNHDSATCPTSTGASRSPADRPTVASITISGSTCPITRRMHSSRMAASSARLPRSRFSVLTAG